MKLKELRGEKVMRRGVGRGTNGKSSQSRQRRRKMRRSQKKEERQ